MPVREFSWREPRDVFAALHGQPGIVWLDSATQDIRGRFSYLTCDPHQVITVYGDRIAVDGQRCKDTLWDLLARVPQAGVDEMLPLPFTGGAVGFLGYELSGGADPHPCRHPANLPDAWFGLYDVFAGFDHQQRRCWVVSTGHPAQASARRHRAVNRLNWFSALIRSQGSGQRWCEPVRWRAETGRAAHESRIRHVLERLGAGDLYQANLTARFVADRPAGFSAAGFYTTLRERSPAPFAAYLACGSELMLCSASPERFLHLGVDRRIESRPIKGTAPRRTDPNCDDLERRRLENSAKDHAENLMIADLLRNDIGRVAEPGSVRTPILCGVESFAHVHHLVSEITASLRVGLTAADLLRAAFPPGSVTGAPKVAAMALIDALEPARRGPYCGSIAWIGYDGAMDSSVLIRTVVVTRDQLIAQAGGGIVVDSDPAAEWCELLMKVEPLLQTGS